MTAAYIATGTVEKEAVEVIVEKTVTKHNGEDKTFVVAEKEIEILSAAEQGPPGAPGPAGNDGQQGPPGMHVVGAVESASSLPSQYGYYDKDQGILDVGQHDGAKGGTPFEAALRAYLLSRVGPAIDVPDWVDG